MMKKRIIALLLTAAVLLGLFPAVYASPAEEGSVAINAENFPDEIFRAYVGERFDTDKNGALSTEELDAAIGIDVMGKNITSLKGVEYFKLLSSLDCSSNQLTSLDLSWNPRVKYLNCSDNRLTSLDVGGNPFLEWLYCSGNQLTSLDLINNNVLSHVGFGGNSYTVTIPASGKLSLFDLPGCFDLTKASNWVGGTVEWDTLTVDPGVETVTYTYAASDKESIMFTLNVVWPDPDSLIINEENFPDERFREYICWNIDTNKDGVLSDAEIAEVKCLNVSERYIASLKGIEYFWALEELDCSFNYGLTELDVSHNPALVKLNCGYDRNLTKLHLSENTALEYLDCEMTKLTSLDLRQSPALTVLRCGHSNQDEAWTQLDISQCPDLTILDCAGCKLGSLDLSVCPLLTEVNCGGNNLKELKLDQNPALTNLQVGNNQITQLDLSKCPALTELYCDGNNLTSLDLRQNPELTMLFCSDNPLAGLNLSNNAMLDILQCESTGLTSIDVSALPVLRIFQCSGNQLTELDVSQNSKLSTLECSNSALTALDLSHNAELSTLDCSNNALTELDLGQNPRMYNLNCSNNALTELDLGQNPRMYNLNCSDNALTGLDLSQNPILTELNCQNNHLVSMDLSKEIDPDPMRFFTGGNTYEISVGADGVFDLNNMPKSFDPARAQSWSGATVDGSLLTVADGQTEVTYYYQTGWNRMRFTLRVNWQAEPTMAIDAIRFPDENFRAFISANCDTDGDGRLSKAEQAAVTKLDISGLGITDLTGLAYFQNLSELDCSDNNLGRVELSENRALTDLKCSNSQITYLNVRELPALTTLDCSDNSLFALDVSNNPALTSLNCDNNRLSSLNLESNRELTQLSCENNISDLPVKEDGKISIHGWTEDLLVGKTSNWTGGTVDGYTLTVDPGATTVGYDFAASDRFTVHFIFHVVWKIAPEFAITAQPESYAGQVGDNAVFCVGATGDRLSYRWFWSKNEGKSWYVSTLPGADTDMLQVSMTANRVGQWYRCQVTDCNGKVLTSEIAILTVDVPATELKITGQPASFYGIVGDTATFHVAAEGDGLSYQWYWSKNEGKTWSVSSINGADTDTLQIVMTAGRVGQRYRCQITDRSGKVLISDAVTLAVDVPATELKITGQPVSFCGIVGDTATFHVAAEGEGLTYQWYWSKNDGKTWSVSTTQGADTDTLQIAMTTGRVGQQYRCQITDRSGKVLTCETVTLGLAVSATVITSQPENFYGGVGDTAIFHVTAEGEGLTYQWYWSKSEGKIWNVSSINGANTNTIEVAVIAGRVGQKYKCVITDANGHKIETVPVAICLAD